MSYLTSELYSDPQKVSYFSLLAEWCTACIKEQPKLQDLYEEFADSSLEIMVTLFQDGDFEPATPEVAATWRKI